MGINTMGMFCVPGATIQGVASHPASRRDPQRDRPSTGEVCCCQTDKA